jgi:hypothetical protein
MAFISFKNSTRNKPEDKNMFLLCNIIGKFENLTHFRQDTVLKLPEINDEQGRVHVIRKVDTIFFLRNCVVSETEFQTDK